MFAYRSPLLRDTSAVSPVIAVILLVAIVVIGAASVFMLSGSFGDGIQQTSPTMAITTRNAEQPMASWSLVVNSAVPAHDLGDFVFVLVTPHNGTLVALPTGPLATNDHYWQLGSSAGTGRHADNGTTVGVDGLGGFYLRLSDISGDGLFGGGDRFVYWYDGNGDQAHQNAADDMLPSGHYRLDIKHVPTDSIVGTDSKTV